MSNFDRAVKALNDVDDYIDHLADNEAYVTALEAAGLLAPGTQIIRTVEELEALDPDTVFMNTWGDLFDANNVQAGINTEDFPYYFPCAVVASGGQVRAAREAMEKEHE